MTEALISVPHSQALATLDTVPELTREMLLLTHRLDSLVPPLPGISEGRIFLFLSPEGGEGTSTLVSEFSRVSALELARSVMVLDAATGAAVRQSSEDRDLMLRNLQELSANGRRPPQGTLVELPFDLPRAYRAAMSRPTTSLAFFEHLRRSFDVTLVDAPPAIQAVESVGISRHVDGVVLVVEESTRSRAARQLKDEVEQAGGHIVGAILNKQEQQLPDWLAELF